MVRFLSISPFPSYIVSGSLVFFSSICFVCPAVGHEPVYALTVMVLLT